MKRDMPIQLLVIAIVIWMSLQSCNSCHADEVYVTNKALRSSILIPDAMDMKQGKPVYRIAVYLYAGEQAMLSGCMNVTNDTNDNVGWAIVLKEKTTDTYVSPRQSRNVTPSMHHDSIGVSGYFQAVEDGTYTFELLIWTGSTAVYGRYLNIDTNKFGQIIVHILN